MNNNYQFHSAPNRDQLAADLATQIGAQVRDLIASKGQAVLALSGGSTPKPLFIELSKMDLDWSKVVITLVDERWVPSSHDLSNAAFLNDHLLARLPDVVRFVPLFNISDSLDRGVELSLLDYAAATRSTMENLANFDIVVLGMGEDGHTASFFPDADNISALIDPMSKEALLTCSSASTQVERVTWSLPRLLAAPYLYLHITGQAKHTVFEHALLEGDARELPIRSVLKQEQRIVQVYYAD